MAAHKLSDSVLQQALDALAAHGKQAAAARALNLPLPTFTSRLLAAKLRGLESALPKHAVPERKPETLEEKTALQKARDEVARLKGDLSNAYRAHAEEDEILALIGVLAKAETRAPDWVVSAKPLKGKATPEVPVTIWSDWHFGEVVDPTSVNGYNAFNSEIAERRARRLVEKTIHLCANHGAGNYPGVIVNLLGDFISGGLHPELAKTDDETRITATLRVRDLLVWAIGAMADHFGRVFLPCTAGNHGRDTPKPEYKGYLHHNFDWLIYQLLRRHFAGDKRVTFQIDGSNEAYYRVFGRQVLAVHGDMLGVKGGDGIIGAIGPIMRGEIKTRGQAASLGRPFDMLLMGHWHQTLWLPRAVVNNSLKGFDEYARNSLRALPSKPSQSLFFIHPRHGVTSRWEVLLDESETTAAKEWVSWEK